jgi:hypothetical protein
MDPGLGALQRWEERDFFKTGSDQRILLGFKDWQTRDVLGSFRTYMGAREAEREPG